MVIVPKPQDHNEEVAGASISLVVLSRDEAPKLDRCLGSLRPYVDEIVVVDTGSVDDSVAVANKHKATVYEMEWPNNWSVALNALISKVKTDWTLRLDQDEWFDPEEGAKLRPLAQQDQVCGYTLVRRDLIEANSDAYDEIEIIRFWRSHEKIHFERAMHEVMRFHLFEEAFPGKVLLRSDVFFWHDGHIGLTKEKGLRNIAYLRKDLEADPGNVITKSYLATTLHGTGDPEGKPMLRELMDELLTYDHQPPYQVALAVAMHMELIPNEEVNDERTARVIAKALEWFPTNPVHLFYAAVLERRRENLERALELFLLIDSLAESNTFDRGMSIPLEFVGERLWKSMGFVATKLGRQDVVKRCQMKLAAQK